MLLIGHLLLHLHYVMLAQLQASLFHSHAQVTTLLTHNNFYWQRTLCTVYEPLVAGVLHAAVTWMLLIAHLLLPVNLDY